MGKTLTFICSNNRQREIGENCFIGFGAVVFKAVLNEWTFVGQRAIVQEVEIEKEKFIPEGFVVAKDSTLKKLTESQREFINKVHQMNRVLAEKYLRTK